MQQAFDLFKTGLESSLSWFVTGLNYTGAGPYIIGVFTALLVVGLLIAPIRGYKFVSNEKKNYDRSEQAQRDNRSAQKQKNVG